MCLAIPGEVVEILDDKRAMLDYGGTRREVDITFVRPEIGEWVVVHAGFALQILEHRCDDVSIQLPGLHRFEVLVGSEVHQHF